MMVYCRFAPPPDGMSVDCGKENVHTSWLAPPLLSLSLRDCGDGRQQTVSLADPLTGLVASSTCRRVFLPACISSSTSGVAPLPVYMAARERQQREVFNEVVRPRLNDLFSGRRCTFLAYGQTATGKTYTMFGLNVDGVATAPRGNDARVQLTTEWKREEEEEGIVPRFLHAVFAASTSSAWQNKVRVQFVELSCLEVYNECTTDLVALFLQQQEQREQKKKQKNNNNNSDVSDVWCERSSPAVEVPRRKVVFKATEKSNVMRSALRLRSRTAAECWSLLRRVLTLRCRSQTERNVRSSRSHLVLRLVFLGGVNGDGVVGESLFVDLAGSETYRENDYYNYNINSNYNNYYQHCYCYNRTAGNNSSEQNSSTNSSLLSPANTPVAASTFTSCRRDASGHTAAQRRLLRTNEMRHINVSLLALRKVVRALHTLSSPSSSSSCKHIPFRDSTLTTILEQFFTSGEESVVTWVVCCSCRQSDFHETVESLRLGAEASATSTCVQLYTPVFSVGTHNNNNNNNNNNNKWTGSVSSSSSNNIDTSCGARKTSLYTRGSWSHSAASIGQSIEPSEREEREKSKRKETTASSSLFGDSVDGGQHKSITSGVGEPNGKEEAKELEKYKQCALHLLDQCNTLCERYGECVEELVHTRKALTSRDGEIARLRRALVMVEDTPAKEKISVAPFPPPPTCGESTAAACMQEAAKSSKEKGTPAGFCGVVTKPGEPHSIGTKEKLYVVGNAEQETEEADRLAKCILERYCVQSGSVDVACKQTETSMNNNRSAALSSPSLSLCSRATANVEAGIVNDDGDGFAMHTPCNKKINSFGVSKAQARREDVVSFVLPSSHGALSLMYSARDTVEPPPRSALRVRATLPKGESHNNGAVHFDKGETRAVVLNNESSAGIIIQKLLSRSASCVGDISPSRIVEKKRGGNNSGGNIIV